VVLSLGILTTLFTALMGTRTVIALIWGRRASIAHLPV
jgi:preprotein translocase subunit SecD